MLNWQQELDAIAKTIRDAAQSRQGQRFMSDTPDTWGTLP